MQYGQASSAAGLGSDTEPEYHTRQHRSETGPLHSAVAGGDKDGRPCRTHSMSPAAGHTERDSRAARRCDMLA